MLYTKVTDGGVMERKATRKSLIEKMLKSGWKEKAAKAPAAKQQKAPAAKQSEAN